MIRLTLILACLLAAAGCRATTAISGLDAQAAAAPASGAPTTVFHIVAFRFKTDDATRAQIPAAVEAFRALQTSVVAPDDSARKLVLSLASGPNNSTEQMSFGAKGVAQDRSTEVDFVLTFASVADRDYYVDVAPPHQAFKAMVGPLLDGGSAGAFVTDFVAQ